ncbi:hypothetical protein M0805_006156 [Coniferiporia weirii]|nr:hypothetical protein M0805_006156 [Coniferiporia weirii]
MHMYTLRCYIRGTNPALWDDRCRILGFRALSAEHRTYSSLRDTPPGVPKPSESPGKPTGEEQGYLAFTKASLYKLTLPLSFSSEDPTSPFSKISSNTVQRYKPYNPSDSLNGGATGGSTSKNREAWEQQVESGDLKEPLAQMMQNPGEEETGRGGVHSVIFLLHSGQPLSYVAGLIRSEGPEIKPAQRQHSSHNSHAHIRDTTDHPPITFHTSPDTAKHWSPSTGIGDFLREAARVGSFTIAIGARHIRVNVPSFEERTRFLRAALVAKTAQINRLARVKSECDRIARQSTQRVAFAGAGIMATWWVTVGVLTFDTELGWDTMEPITYLTGFGTVISGYLWFLWHNREVSYRTVLSETTSRRQQKLYAERGFDIEAYHELIDEVKGLRREIKRVAWDYELDWDQGKTTAGERSRVALDIVRKEEAKERKGRRNRRDDSAGEDEADTLAEQVDNNDSRQPGQKQGH